MSNAQIAVLAAAVCLTCTACPRTRVAVTVPPVVTDKEMEALDMVQLAIDIGQEEGRRIWPGFAAGDSGVLVFRPGKRSFLVNPSFKPSGLPLLDVPGIRVPVYELKPGVVQASAGLPFSKGFPVAGGTAFLVRHRKSDSYRRWFRLLVHELFHDHQHGNWERRGFPERCRYPYEDKQNAFLARVEEKLASRMLQLLPYRQVKSTALHYLAVRARRYALKTGADVKDIEFWEELAEGTAKYVEEHYAAAAGLSTLAAATTREASFFNSFNAKNLQKWKYYRTGLALCMAMDQMKTGAWKEAAGRGEPQYTHLSEAVEPELALLDKDAVDTIIQAHQGERPVVEQKMEEYVATENDILDRWLKQGQWEVTLVFGQKGGAYYSNSGVTFNLPDCSRMVSGIISFVDRLFNFEVRRKAVVVSHQEVTYKLVFYDNLDDGTMALDSKSVAFEEGDYHFATSIKVRESSWNIDWSGQGRVTVTPGHVRIELGPAG